MHFFTHIDFKSGKGLFMNYDEYFRELQSPVTESAICIWVKEKFDELLDALKKSEQEEIRRIVSDICSPFESIRDAMHEEAKFRIEQEIETRRFAADGADDDDYFTSEPEQSKFNEDAQEVMERADEESDIQFNEAFGFAEVLEKLKTLPGLEVDAAVKLVTDMRAKYFS
jgi:hypothetical protein